MAGLAAARRPVLAALWLVALAVGVAVAQDGQRATAIRWLSYREARAQARDLDRPMLLQFAPDWNEEWHRMRRETYRDRRIIAAVDRYFVACRVEAERLPSLARKYGVGDEPVLWLLAPDGSGLTRLSGHVPPHKLEQVLEFVRTDAWRTSDFQTWVTRRKGASRR